jgi:hypothetical protein
MNLATNQIKSLASRKSDTLTITLDNRNKRLYWIERDRNSFDYIFSSDYDFLHQKYIKHGSFRRDMLIVFGDSLYFQNDYVFSINQINSSDGKTVRIILVDKATYYGLIVVHRSLLPMGM